MPFSETRHKLAGFVVKASDSSSSPSCCCFVLVCVHNDIVSSCSSLPGTRWPSSNLPWRKGPVCGHWAQIWPAAVVLVWQAEPSRGSACLRHQVGVPHQFINVTHSNVQSTDPPISASIGMPSPCGILMQTREPELKKSTWQVGFDELTVLIPYTSTSTHSTTLTQMVCSFLFVCPGAGEKGVKVELGKPSDPS